MERSSLPESHSSTVELVGANSYFGFNPILVDLLEHLIVSGSGIRTTQTCPLRLMPLSLFCNHKAYCATVVKKQKLFVHLQNVLGHSSGETLIARASVK